MPVEPFDPPTPPPPPDPPQAFEPTPPPAAVLGGGAAWWEPWTTDPRRTTFVSQSKGHDLTAIPRRADRAYGTLSAAINAAQAGDTIHVLDGIFAEHTLGKDGITIHFEEGTGVSVNEPVNTATHPGSQRYLFGDHPDGRYVGAPAPIRMRITGRGFFEHGFDLDPAEPFSPTGGSEFGCKIFDCMHPESFIWAVGARAEVLNGPWARIFRRTNASEPGVRVGGFDLNIDEMLCKSFHGRLGSATHCELVRIKAKYCCAAERGFAPLDCNVELDIGTIEWYGDWDRVWEEQSSGLKAFEVEHSDVRGRVGLIKDWQFSYRDRSDTGAGVAPSYLHNLRIDEIISDDAGGVAVTVLNTGTDPMGHIQVGRASVAGSLMNVTGKLGLHIAEAISTIRTGPSSSSTETQFGAGVVGRNATVTFGSARLATHLVARGVLDYANIGGHIHVDSEEGDYNAVILFLANGPGTQAAPNRRLRVLPGTVLSRTRQDDTPLIATVDSIGLVPITSDPVGWRLSVLGTLVVDHPNAYDDRLLPLVEGMIDTPERLIAARGSVLPVITISQTDFDELPEKSEHVFYDVVEDE